MDKGVPLALAWVTTEGRILGTGSVDSPDRNAPEAAEFIARSKVKAVGPVMAIWYLPTNTCKKKKKIGAGSEEGYPVNVHGLDVPWLCTSTSVDL